ncbi:right-handed parallel beta-helix repeat-containing protein [Acinetobacter pittii]|uniref:right-handed parallel beta-helix repeat-containing protein n=1 Tax=Acinetobacter pittii TaxID=48296 RepID=UPI001C21104D|nr:right-handed parallel beta-helix repeat-containing protein [Acinetobacter pittii]QXA07979.1 right-handed parallel beta-helix repeat-containing protein [Acinetobacter pittii]
MKFYCSLTLACLTIFPSIVRAEFVENSDITNYVNTLIEKEKVVTIPSGNFKINANKSIIPKDGTIIKMSDNTRLYVIPNKYDSYRIFKINNVKDVSISGGQLIGDKHNHLSKKGEWGMGIEIRDSKNINISDIQIDKMWGDGIYIGSNGKNSTYNINLNNIRMNDNRRQGITITSVNKLTATNLQIENTGGTPPANGIDIEPNNDKSVLKDIKVKGLKTKDNKGVGFQVSLKHLNASSSPISISLENHKDSGSNFGLVVNGLTSPLTGKIDINGVNYSSNKFANFCFNSWKNNVDISLNNITHDKKNIFRKHSWCFDYNQEPKIKIGRVVTAN